MDMRKLYKLKRELDVKIQISLEGGNSDNADERDRGLVFLPFDELDGREFTLL